MDGRAVGRVLKRFAPTSKAKYVAFTTLADPQQMPGVRYRSINWPYREGLRIDEAMHPLTLLATGLYGKPLPQQNGAPLRLVVPWKYGFKSIKSIVEIRFVEKCPKPPGTICNRPNTASFQRQSGGGPPALESEDRAPHRRHGQQTVRRAYRDQTLQRVRRSGRFVVRGHGSEKVVLGDGSIHASLHHCKSALARDRAFYVAPHRAPAGSYQA